MEYFLTFPNKAAWDALDVTNCYAVQVYAEMQNFKMVPNPAYVEGGEEPLEIAQPLDEYLVNVFCPNGLPEALQPFDLGFTPVNPKRRLWRDV
jgi:hypothetical protein